MKKLSIIAMIFSTFLLYSQSQNENYVKTTLYKIPFQGIENYNDFNQNLSLIDLAIIGFIPEGGGGNISLANNIFSVDFNVNNLSTNNRLQLGNIKTLNTNPAVPDLFLGPIFTSQNSNVETGYFAKIQNNKLVFYSPYFLNGINCSFTANISNGDVIYSYDFSYLDQLYNYVAGSNATSSGHIEISDGTIIVNLEGTWNEKTNLKLGTIVHLNTSTPIPDTELGVIKCAGLNTFYNAKIENNDLKFYSTSSNIPARPASVGLTFSKNIGITAFDKSDGITYFDGLGRPIQKIANGQSSTGKDIVTPIEYDDFGRQAKDFLPFIPTTAPSLEIKTNEVLSFYGSNNIALTGNPSFATTDNPFSQKDFETSPLNRVLKQAAPGNEWKLGSDHEIKFDYQTNILNEVRKFKISFAPNSTEIHSAVIDGFYLGNELYKTVTKNEDWTSNDGLNKTTQEFKNKEGQVILKRTFNNNQAHNTYYLYDIYGNLSYVIPPTASDAIDATYNNSAISNRNYPWTTLALVDGKLAELYDRLFSEYQNEFIVDADLFNKYGGQGGLSISSNSSNEPVLTINISTLEPMELRVGKIISLENIGEFKDSELGRISGEGYEYIFSISKNTLFVAGKGLLNNIDVTFNGNTKLVYNVNYPWAAVVDIDPKIAQEYIERYNEIENANVLTTEMDNPFGATGGINITIDQNDQIGINFDITCITPLALKRGIVMQLKTERRIADTEMEVIDENGMKYIIGIKENSLYIEGEGNFNQINLQRGIVPPPPFSMAIPAAITDGLCYIYRYDARNRLIEKKIPGKGWEYIVYDKADRPILTQDANLRLSKKWLFTKYDAFNRVVYTGQLIFNSTSTNTALRIQLQALVTNSNVLNESKTQTTFQNGGISINYSQNSYPNNSSINITNFDVYSVNYYDNYSFYQPNPITIPVTSYNSTTPNNILTNLKSLQTGSLTRILNTNDWIINVVAYDKKSRLVWSESQNSYLNTDDVTETQLDFIGNVLETKTIHNKTGASNKLTVVNKFEYDHADRLLKQTQKIGTQSDELIAFNKYDELGNLIQKKVGGLPLASGTQYDLVPGLQTIDYSYNIRGWLKTMNDPTALNNNLFAFAINYNDPQLGSTALFNGNISETSWITSNDYKVRSYKYSFDDLNRLTNAEYVGNYSLVNNSNQTENYTEGNIEYDKNGNITKLERFGLKTSNTSIVLIDKLIYNYPQRSNKLQQIIDTSLESDGFKDNASSANDYYYDINGNMKIDKNKDIVNIDYNYLNLPTRIDFKTTAAGNTKYIEYIYAADGTKLKKIVKPEFAPNVTTTEYAGGYIYENNSLQFFSHPEGYVANTNGVFSYIYQYKDHLGNVRLSYKENGGNLQIIEENNYYPFGLKQQGYNIVYNPIGNELAQKYRYNGKELQEELELNLYDYGARNYDPAIGRWMNIDPLAEKGRRWSPYTYAMNNPVYFIDPDGMLASPIYGSYGEFLGTDENGFEGELIFMSASTFNLVGGQGMKHNIALAVGQTLEGVMGDNPETDFTQGEADMVNNAITDVVSRTEGLEFNSIFGGADLHNGKTSSSYYQQGAIDGTRNETWVESNDANNLGDIAIAVTDRDSQGKANITFNLKWFTGGDFTVGNLQNTWVHEKGNHYDKNVPGESGEAHAKAIDYQSKHSSWKSTTQNYQTNMRSIYKEYTGRPLKR